MTKRLENSAGPAQARSIWTSLGIWNVLLQFLCQEERQVMQLGNKFCYEKAMARALPYFTLQEPLVPQLINQCEIALCDVSNKGNKKLGYHGIRFVSFVTVGLNLFTYSHLSRAWEMWKNALNPANTNFAINTTKAAPIFGMRERVSLVNFKDKLIFFSGGLDQNRSYADVFQYRIGADSWS